MGHFALTRRDAILAGTSTALTGGVLSGCAAETPLDLELDLEDPAVRARRARQGIGFRGGGNGLQVLPPAPSTPT